MATFGTFGISESGKQDMSDSDHRIILQSNTCHPDNGTRLTVRPSGVHASSISLEDRAAGIALTKSSQRKRQRGTSWYSHLTSEQREAYLQRNREDKKRRKSHGAGCTNAQDETDWASCSIRQNIAGQSDNLLSQYTHIEVQDHIISESEDTIYMPMNIFPANQGNFSTRYIFNKLFMLISIIDYDH